MSNPSEVLKVTRRGHDPPFQGGSGEVPVMCVCVSGASATTAEWLSRVGELHADAGIQCFPAERRDDQSGAICHG